MTKVKHAQWRNLLYRLGPGKATVLITGVAVLLSVMITVFALLLFVGGSRLSFAITISAALPGVTIPSLSYFVLRILAQVEQAEREKARLVVELQDALLKVKRLSGLLPICSACKKIRDDDGYWHQVEVYLHSHSEVDFSHSICPDCVQELYPAFQKHREEKENVLFP